MATNTRARLAALERSSGLLPADLSLWSDSELAAAAAGEPLAPMLAALTDEDLERVRDADDDRPLSAVLAHLGHPSSWPAAAGWSTAAHLAANAAWHGDPLPPPPVT